MPLSIDTLDDEPITDETPLFSAGQISNARPATLPPNAAFSLQNCEISTTGRLITRRGTDRLGDAFPNPVFGIAYYKTPTNSDLLAFVDDGGGLGRVKIWNGTIWDDPAGGATGNFSTLPINAVQGENETATVPTLYLTQSGLAPQFYNGLAFSAITSTITHPQFCEWHTDRLFLAGASDAPDTLSPSKFLDGTQYDAVNWDFRIGAGDGDPITGLRSWSNANLVVFKEHSVWIVNCDPTLLLSDATLNSSAFPINQVHKQIGCLAANSAVQVGSDIFFLSDSGVRSLMRTIASESQSQVGPALSDPIDDIIQRINMAAVQWASAVYWRNKYILALPLDSSAYPNYVVVYNTLTQSWSGFWTNWQSLCWTRRIDGETPKLVFGQADGSVTDFLDFIDESSEVDATFEDQGVTYPTDIESRAFTCGDQDSPKTGLFTRMEFKESQGDVTVSAIAGKNETPQELASFSTVGNQLTLPFVLPVTLPSGGYLPKSLDLFALGQWREIRIKIHSDAHKIALNKISVSAFMDAYMIQQ